MRGCPRTRTQRERYIMKEELENGGKGWDSNPHMGAVRALTNLLPPKHSTALLYLSYPSKLRYCIAHNPLLFQPLGHWFTFIYRKCEHLAVGSLGQGLTRSRGHPPSWLPCPPLLCFHYSTFCRGCQEEISTCFGVFFTACG